MVAFRDKPACKAALEALVGPGIAKPLILEVLRDLYDQLGGDESWTTIKAHDYRRVRTLLDRRTAKKAKLMGQPENETQGPTQAQLSEAVRLLCELMAVPPEYVVQTVTSIYETYGGQPEAWSIIKEDDWAQVIEYIQNDPARPTLEQERASFLGVGFGGPNPSLQALHEQSSGGLHQPSSQRPPPLESVFQPVRGEPTSVNTPISQSTRPQSPKSSPKAGPPRLGANPGTLSPREKRSSGAQLLEMTSSLPLHAGLVKKSQEATEEAQRKRKREREHLEGLRTKARKILGGGRQSPRATASQAPAKEEQQKKETRSGGRAEGCEEGMRDGTRQDSEGHPEQTRTACPKRVDRATPQSPSTGSKSEAVGALEHALTRLREVGANETSGFGTPAQKGGVPSRGGGEYQDGRADVLGGSDDLRGGSVNGGGARVSSQPKERTLNGGLEISQSPVVFTSLRLPASPVREGAQGLGSDGGAAEGSQGESRRKLERLKKVGDLSPGMSGDARKGSGAKLQGAGHAWRPPVDNPPRPSKLKSLNAILEKNNQQQEMDTVPSSRTGDPKNEGKADKKRRKPSLERSPPDQRVSPSEEGRHIRVGRLLDSKGASPPNPEEAGNTGEERVVCEDISRGMERQRIRCVNGVTGDDLPPSFRYMSKNRPYDLARKSYLDCLSRLVEEDQCKCEGDCLASDLACCCTKDTRGGYAYGTDGRLTPEFLGNELRRREEVRTQGVDRAQDFIKECSDLCSCNLQCNNRVVQRGIAVKLEVFGAGSRKGWGVRCLEDLQPGTFVCEYVGEILTTDELEARNQRAGDVHHSYPVELTADPVTEFHVDNESGLCLDATSIGNVARFINHRCGDAPLIDIPVEIEGPDHNYYHVAFFTKCHVEALTELTWDYGTDFDDVDHPVKAFRCVCNSSVCRGA